MIDPRLGQRYIEDVQVGDEFGSPRSITTEQVAAFFSASIAPGLTRRSFNGRYFNAEEARRDGLERPMVPGPMSAAVITSVLSEWIGAFGRIVSLDLTYRRPVLQGEELSCVGVVTDVDHEALEPAGPALVSLDVSLERPDGERPVQGAAIVELPRRVE